MRHVTALSTTLLIVTVLFNLLHPTTASPDLVCNPSITQTCTASSIDFIQPDPRIYVVWSPNETVTIEWMHNGFGTRDENQRWIWPEKVHIILADGNNQTVKVVATEVPIDKGFITWTIPQDVPEWKPYWLRILVLKPDGSLVIGTSHVLITPPGWAPNLPDGGVYAYKYMHSPDRPSPYGPIATNTARPMRWDGTKPTTSPTTRPLPPNPLPFAVCMKICREHDSFFNCVMKCRAQTAKPDRDDRNDEGRDEGSCTVVVDGASNEAIKLVFAFGVGALVSALVSAGLFFRMRARRDEYKPLSVEEDDGLVADVDGVPVEGDAQ